MSKTIRPNPVPCQHCPATMTRPNPALQVCHHCGKAVCTACYISRPTATPCDNVPVTSELLESLYQPVREAQDAVTVARDRAYALWTAVRVMREARIQHLRQTASPTMPAVTDEEIALLEGMRDDAEAAERQARDVEKTAYEAWDSAVQRLMRDVERDLSAAEEKANAQ